MYVYSSMLNLFTGTSVSKHTALPPDGKVPRIGLCSERKYPTAVSPFTDVRVQKQLAHM